MFKGEIKGYLEDIAKYKRSIIILCAIIEIFIFAKLGKTNILTVTSSLFVTPVTICGIVLMLKNIENAILLYSFSIPLLPIILYILMRLNLGFMGIFTYVIYFGIYVFVLYKDRDKLAFKNLILRGSFKFLFLAYTSVFILAFVTCFFSINIIESLKLVFLAIFTNCVFCIGILSYKGFNKQLLKKVITYLCLGAAISSLPDIVVTFYNIIFNGANIHLYGVLGSNFMLGYTLLVMPMILLFSVNKNYMLEYKKLYISMLVIQMINFSIQQSRGILLALAMEVLIVFLCDIKNYKKYIIVSFVIFPLLSYNVFNRAEFKVIQSQRKAETKVEKITPSQVEKNFFKDLAYHARNRSEIWGSALDMVHDKPYFGFGPGQFKNVYFEYGGDKKYSDAHNIILNIATEFGLIFTGVFFVFWFILFIRSLVFSIKNKVNTKVVFVILGGLVAFFVYGNITGQNFFTSREPISITPAFVFAMVSMILEKITDLHYDKI